MDSISMIQELSEQQASGMVDREDVLRISEDEDDSMGEEEPFSASDLLQSGVQDDITSSLAASGTIPGLAAAAAVMTARKRQRPYKFETNPCTRKRHHTRLVRKLKQTMHEFCTRCGQQAVLLCVNPGKENASCKVFGASPLDQVIRSYSNIILNDLERILQEQAPANGENNVHENAFELPQLVIDGIPTPVDKMNQAQLRMFIPEMLKYSTGRGKPGWGKDSTKPKWWPLDVPWANVRRDARSDEQKMRISWTQALRQIVKNCYKYHGRDDLLHFFPNEQQNTKLSLGDRFASSNGNRNVLPTSQNLNPPTLVQTIQNSDGSVSLVQLDSGQTIATITQDQTGAAIATLTGQDNSEGPLAVTMHQVGNGQWGASDLQASIAALPSDIRLPSSSSVPNDTNSSVQTTGNAKKGNNLRQHRTSQQSTHNIGITIDNGQAYATIHNTPIQSNGQIMLATDVSETEETNNTAMVQIPVSVYEKIANTIQQCGGTASNHGELSLSGGTMHLASSETLTTTVRQTPQQSHSDSISMAMT